MRKNHILQYNAIITILFFSVLIAVSILLFSSNGLSNIRRQQIELAEYRYQLRNMYHYNLELVKETHRFVIKDIELYESLARQRGLVRPGESVYIFHDASSNNCS